MVKHRSLYSKIIVGVIFLVGLSAYFFDDIREQFYKSDVAVTETVASQETFDIEGIKKSEEMKIPDEFNLGIIFYSQAPYGNWDLPYQESCEEASLLLAYYYLTGQKVDKETYHQDLLRLIEWEKMYFGQYLHTSIEETAEMAEQYFGLNNYEIVENPHIEQMKEFLAQGFPIVAPFSGRDLGNPFFSGTDPFYHMLVIRGYEDGKFITNDVGTRRGENFVYSEEVIMNALHDLHEDVFTDPAAVVKGAKKILVLKPNRSPSAAGLETGLAE